MNRKALLILGILLFSFAASAQTDSTVISKDHYRLTKKEFLKQYGTDSACRAIINFYFDKRSSIVRAMLLPLPFVVATIGYEEQKHDESDFVLFPAAPVLFLLSAPVCIPVGINGIIYCVKYSKKNLYKTLITYINTKQIPAALVEKIQKFEKKYGSRRR